MKKTILSKTMSAVLAASMVFAMCSCATKREDKDADVTEEQIETEAEESSKETSEETDATTESSADNTTGSGDATVPSSIVRTDGISGMFSSAIGKDIDQAVEVVEKYLGTELTETEHSESPDGLNGGYSYTGDLVVAGFSFDSVEFSVNLENGLVYGIVFNASAKQDISSGPIDLDGFRKGFNDIHEILDSELGETSLYTPFDEKQESAQAMYVIPGDPVICFINCVTVNFENNDARAEMQLAGRLNEGAPEEEQ